MSIAFMLCCAALFMRIGAADETLPFQGAGTLEEPYQIRSVEELELFRDRVNEGETFAGCYFYQANDLDLEGKAWTPIGVSGTDGYFEGVYNGGGHRIENLNIFPTENRRTNNQGFFGQLAGTVVNLGIESGTIRGNFAASIASRSVWGTSPVIINCYSRADVSGTRAGGIVDNFAGGTVISCWYDQENGKLKGEETGVIASRYGLMIDCYGLTKKFCEDYEDGILAPHGDFSEAETILEGPEASLGAWYAAAFVEDIGIIIPWEWKDGSLQFAQESMEEYVVSFQGEGTQETPYLIETDADLYALRELVNRGEEFRDTWFRQTADIDLQDKDWKPIGIYGTGNYFLGVYDGNGHVIDGIETKKHGAGYLDNVGMFGQLGGVVANLGLEHLNIQGECCGGIASSSTGTDEATILNCYTQGEISGERVGGIADAFNIGSIVCCISTVELHPNCEEDTWKSDWYERRESLSGGITAVSGNTKVYSCFTTETKVMPEAASSKTSWPVSFDGMTGDWFRGHMNDSTAMAQVLFGNHFGLSLLQWELSEEGTVPLQFSQDDQRIMLFQTINVYLLPALLILLLLGFGFLLWKKGIRQVCGDHRGALTAITIISGVVSVFVDCAAAGTARNMLNAGNVMFLVLINFTFVASAFLNLRYRQWKRPSLKQSVPLLAVMALVMVLELLQFDLVPRYDGSLYYGSLVKAMGLFRLDLFTYIGAFVCWKWAHGAALLIAPLEFLFPGQMFGVYVSNLIISEVTLVVMYRLVRSMFRQVSPVVAAAFSAVLIFCPYQLAMFTYLSWDPYLAYFAVWLLYSYYRKNHLMTAFCGYLLAFSKISGLVFYVIFLITATLVELVVSYQGNFLKRIAKWWKWGKCLVWMAPAFLYLLTMRYGEMLTIQHFNGSYTPDSSVAIKDLASLGNTLIQSFVFGFRWLFVLIALGGLIFWLRKRRQMERPINTAGRQILWGTVAGSFVLLAVLLLYNSDAECPRYTALFNLTYVLVALWALLVLVKKEKLRTLLVCALAVLLLVQNYWTIDPLILLHDSGINTGVKQLHRLALDSDSKPGMNFGTEYRCIGDIYAYNLEYTYYNGLIRDLMTDVQPDEDDTFYVLDVIDYEFHLRGNQYPMYWNQRTENMTYDGADADSILLNVGAVTTEDMEYVPEGYLNWQDDFYLVVAERVNDTEAVQRLQEEGYEQKEEYHLQNCYGAMHAYHFVMP